MSRSFKVMITFLVGLMSYLFFVWMTLPLDVILRQKLADEIPGFRVTFSDIDPSLFFTTTLTDVVVDQNNNGAFETLLKMNELKIDFSLLSLLRKKLEVQFQAQLEGGDVVGAFRSTPGQQFIELKFDTFDLNEIPGFKTITQTPSLSFQCQGLISGTLNMKIVQNDFKNSELDFNFSLPGLKVNHLQAPVFVGKNIPEITLSSSESPATLEGSLANGQLRLSELTFPGPDLDIQLKGKVNLKQDKAQIGVSRLDLKGRFSFSQAVLDAIPELGLLSAQKGADGFYPLNFSGRMEKPSLKIGDMDLASIIFGM